jgi:hypothetical protein
MLKMLQNKIEVVEQLYVVRVIPGEVISKNVKKLLIPIYIIYNITSLQCFIKI